MDKYREKEEWTTIGGYILGEKMPVLISSGDIAVTITLPKLGLSGRGISYREAYWRLLYEFERALKEPKEFDDIEWKRLRVINKLKEEK